MKIKMIYKKAKEDVKYLEQLKINKASQFKCLVVMIISAILLAVPFALIFISLFKQISHIMISYYILMIVIAILIYFLNAIMIVVYYDCLKFYVKEDEYAQSINLKNIFIKELCNPIIFIIALVIILTINFIIWR